MKKIIKPFDLEAAKNGAKIETRNGKKVEILRWDLNNKCSILGIVTGDDGYESFVGWGNDGTSPFKMDIDNDLVIVEYKDEEEKEVELHLSYCDNGLFYEIHYKNDVYGPKSLICPYNEELNKLCECLISLINDKMNLVLTNKVKIEMKLTPIKNESKTEKKGMEVD